MAQGLALLADEGATDRFGLAEVVDGEAKSVSIAVRGDIVVDLGSATTSRFSWPEGSTWLAGEALGVESLRLALHKLDSSAAHLPLARGVVRAIEASVTLVERPYVATAPAEPLTEVVGEPAQAAPAASIALAATTLLVAEADSISPAGSAVSAPLVDRTPQRLDLASHAPELGWTLTLPDGNKLDAAPQIVVGRRPWRTDPDETSTYYIVAPSPRKEISGKHVEFAVVGNELQARDMGSTNGTLVLAQDKAPRLLHEGRAVRLDIGDTLDLGEGFRIVVGART